VISSRQASRHSAVGIVAAAVVEPSLASIDSLRRADDVGPPLPPRFLRHADPQTVAAVRAVQQAAGRLTEDARLPGDSLEGHGVIAAASRLGRPAAGRALDGFASSGGIAVPTTIVPQCSLHAVAGAVSVAFGMHGPNIGIGGGPGAVAEGLIAAASFACDPRPTGGVAGWWLVFTGWECEPPLDVAGTAAADPLVRAVALCVVPALAEEGDFFGSVAITPSGGETPRADAAGDPLAALAAAVRDRRPWSLPLPGGGTATIIPSAAPRRAREAA